ncbi:(deoxy)nucleoside triphosphate pyrophosphohydrolase [Arthrobacter antioxidans]|uniref:(deoxy)nucleoside triphosphate pyrophosphohydrolase n=1 Tax=Arthrobacter antioxidans TaxID=2895818 RepID=UPI001FFF05ED|nr:(deoxy)nucleoside triphosphate pyrophosphohydrolase [Arthrobacter antioxidans]
MQPPSDQLLQIVGAAVVDSLAQPTRLLVARRSAPPQFAGMWEFPGGKVEAGEDCEAALLRELKEELGVTARLGSEIIGPGPQGWPLNERAAMRVWLAEVTAGEAMPLQDHDDLRWLPLHPGGELEALPWIPADRPILAALHLATAHRAAL